MTRYFLVSNIMPKLEVGTDYNLYAWGSFVADAQVTYPLCAAAALLMPP